MESVIQKLVNSVPGCEPPPRLLGEHSMGYKETDSGSTESSQGLEGGREVVVECTFCWLKMPLASYIPRLTVPDFVLQLQWREQDIDAIRLDILLGPNVANVGRPHIGNIFITHLATLKADDSLLPWHTGWVYLQSAPDHPLSPHFCPAAHLIVWAYMLGYEQCPIVFLLTRSIYFH